MGAAEIARWLDEHTALPPSVGLPLSVTILVALCVLVGALFLSWRRWWRSTWRWPPPGVFIACLGLEAVVVTVVLAMAGAPMSPIAGAYVLLGAFTLMGCEMIALYRERTATDERHGDLQTRMEALKDALVKQFQLEALEIKAGLEKHLLDMRMSADKTDKAVILHQLWDIVAHVSGLGARYFKKFGEAQSIPANLMGASWINEKARREKAANFEASQALKDYNRDRYNQVATMRNTLMDKYNIGSKEFDDTLKLSTIDFWGLAKLPFFLNRMAEELRNR